MTLLTKPALGLSSPKFSMATWFKITNPTNWTGSSSWPLGVAQTTIIPIDGPGLVGALPLMEWGYKQNLGGDSSGVFCESNSFVWLMPYYHVDGETNIAFPRNAPGMSPTGAIIMFQLSGQYFPPFTFDEFSDPDVPFKFGDPSNKDNTAGSWPNAILKAYVPGFDFASWHHLLVTADVTVPDVTGPLDSTQGSLMEITLDGAMYCGVGLGNPFEAVSGFNPSRTGSFGHGQYGFPGRYLGNSEFTMPSWQNDALGECSIPGVAMNVSAFGSTYNYATVVYAHTQAWWGVYIDPTNSMNLAQFFTIKGSRIVPKDNGTSAATAFGPPQIWFSRDKKASALFQDNRGTVGAFSTSGTAPADFTPGPGQ